MLTNPRSWLWPNLIDLYDDARFEFKATWGRFWSKRVYRAGGLEYLHLGCGDHKFPDFLNTDSFSNSKADLGVDLRFPLPFGDSVWKGIYSHHVFEHIPYESIPRLCAECFRTLKSGGVLRIVVPDAERFVRAYSSPRNLDQMVAFYPQWGVEARKLTPMQIINHVFRDNKFNRHEYAWDFETFESVLRDAGFNSVARAELNKSRDARLAGHDNPRWEAHSLYLEAVK